MHKILACIDRRGNTDAVIDWAAWAALRIGLCLEFLHVLERHPEVAAVSDFSGAIGVNAQESLLHELSEQDARHSRLAREAGRELLARARGRAAAAGMTRLDARLRHGDFVETVIELQADAGLLVLGEHPHVGGGSALRSDRHLESVIRATRCPVLVATAEAFVRPARVVVAFDGSAAARRALAGLTRHPLAVGLPVHLAMAGEDTPQARRTLQEAQAALIDAGIACSVERVSGAAQQVLPELVKAQAPALLVMGAYGHSRLRRLVSGSTTTTLLRVSEVPVLVLR
jgi:nucleotide-binding universal stress UspA family protein